MKLYVIFAQRKEHYFGEYAPEALDVADEFAYDENPDWLQDKLKNYRTEAHWEKVEIIGIDVTSNLIEAIMRPDPIKAYVSGKENV